MTIRELKEKLEDYGDDLTVVAFSSEGDCMVDIFIREVNVSCDGNYSGRHSQKYYTESVMGESALLISIEPPKKRI